VNGCRFGPEICAELKQVVKFVGPKLQATLDSGSDWDDYTADNLKLLRQAFEEAETQRKWNDL